jgi:hypothetical protein
MTDYCVFRSFIFRDIYYSEFQRWTTDVLWSENGALWLMENGNSYYHSRTQWSIFVPPALVGINSESVHYDPTSEMYYFPTQHQETSSVFSEKYN